MVYIMLHNYQSGESKWEPKLILSSQSECPGWGRGLWLPGGRAFFWFAKGAV
jgi:hypothetical protein